MSPRLLGLIALGTFSAAITAFSLFLLIRLNAISPIENGLSPKFNDIEQISCAKRHSAHLFGYEFCLPADWKLAEFGEYKTTLAVHPQQKVSQPAEALITISVLEANQVSAADLAAKIRSKLKNHREERIQLDGLDAAALSGFNQVIKTHIFITRGRYTYEITFFPRRLTKAEAEGYKNLLSSWKWIPIVSHIPVQSHSGNLVLTLPLYDGLLRSPQTLSGRLRSTYNTLTWRIQAGTGEIIASGTLTPSENGEFYSFSTTVRFTPPSPRDPGYIEIFTLSPLTGKEEEMIKIPVRF